MTSAHAIEGGWPHKRAGKKALGAALLAAMAAKGEGRGEHGRHRQGRHRDRMYGPGFGPWMMGFGGPPFGRGGPFGRGPKARRGDVRTAALLLLAEEPRNGYQIMQEIEERSEGVWRPSPGSIYPALQQLEDEGLIRTTEGDGRKLYELTDAGRAYVAERDQELPAPWEEMTDGVSGERVGAAEEMRSVAMAFAQVMRAGNDAQVEEARRALADARRRLYGILAEDEPAPGEA
jgi:DNA-binding PadR family transcriptional regulator